MSSSVITQQSTGLATEAQSGLVSTDTQSFAGNKTFSGTTIAFTGTSVNVSGNVLTPNRPMFSVFSDLYVGAGQTYSTEVFYQTSNTPLGISIIMNIGSNFNATNGRFTAPVAGYYYFSSEFSRTSGNATLELFKNGSTSGIRSLSYGADWQTASVSGSVYLNASDYVNIRFGGTNSTTTNGYRINFSGFLIG